jgi:hypothetical protein
MAKVNIAETSLSQEDKEILEYFMTIMVQRIEQNAFRGGWKTLNTDRISGAIIRNVQDYVLAIKTKDVVKAVCSTADIANYAMILADLTVCRGAESLAYDEIKAIRA